MVALLPRYLANQFSSNSVPPIFIFYKFIRRSSISSQEYMNIAINPVCVLLSKILAY